MNPGVPTRAPNGRGLLRVVLSAAITLGGPRTRHAPPQTLESQQARRIVATEVGRVGRAPQKALVEDRVTVLGTDSRWWCCRRPSPDEWRLIERFAFQPTAAVSVDRRPSHVDSLGYSGG